MRIYIRYSFCINTDNLSKVEEINCKRIAGEYFNRCKKYSLYDTMYMVRLPIDSPEFMIVQEFRTKYKDIAFCIPTYDFEFSKQEKENAEYYLLLCDAAVVIPGCKAEYDGYCCSKETIKKIRFYDYTLKQSDMKNKVIAFTSGYRFLVSPLIKEACEKENISNIEFEPVYTRKKELLAYFIESKRSMPEINSVNKWNVLNKCNSCNSVIYYGSHTVSHPFLIPKKIKMDLQDMNSTHELFTEIRAPQYIISKKFYQILVENGAKKLVCEPIVFVE